MFASYRYFLFYIVASISVIGNALIYAQDLNIILTILALLMFLIMVKCVPKPRNGVITGSLLLIPFFYIFFSVHNLHIEYNAFYGLWPLKMILLVCVIYLYFGLQTEESLSNKNNLKLSLLFFILFTFTILTFGHLEDGRLMFLFGPNMLYRWTILFYLIYLFQYYSAKTSFNNSVIFLLASGILVVTLAEIGSKGGVVVLILAVLPLFYKLKKYFYLLLLALAIALAILQPEYENYRLLNFNNLSDSVRAIFALDFVRNLDIYIFSLGLDNSIFMKNYGSFGFKYPHNLIFELIYYFGFFGFIISLYCIKFLIKSYSVIINFTHTKLVSYKVLIAALYVVLFFSSMFSGDLSDNYSVLSLMIFGSIVWK